MIDMIRILHVIPNMQMGGLETFIMNLYRHINRDEVQFDFLTHYKQDFFYDDEITSLGGKIYHLSVRNDNNIVKYVYDLNRFFKQHQEYKIIHGHMESLGFFYLGVAKKNLVPVRIAHAHNSATESTLKGRMKNVLRQGYSTFATDLFACSEIAGNYMFGCDRNYKIIHNAIDINKFEYNPSVRQILRKKLNINLQQLVVGHVGRFEKQKNHYFILKIFADLLKKKPDSILLLLGKGDLFEAVKSRAEAMGIYDHIRFLGVRNDVDKIYQAMDVFLMPSLFEGLPVSGIEAQASGLPCVFSTNITQELAVTGNVRFLSLQDPVSKWSDTIITLNSQIVRENTSQDIINAGYEIDTQSNLLQQFYKNKWGEC